MARGDWGTAGADRSRGKILGFTLTVCFPAFSVLHEGVGRFMRFVCWFVFFLRVYNFLKGFLRQDQGDQASLWEVGGHRGAGVPLPSSASSSQVVYAASQDCIKMQICPCLLGADSKTPNRKEAAENKQRAAREGSWNRGFFLIIFPLSFSFSEIWLFGGILFNGI